MSWSESRSESYTRLAFLGDSVLALAITQHLYPRLDPDRYGAGELTKIRAQTVSGRSCMMVAERIGMPERLVAAAPEQLRPTAETLVRSERMLASALEAAIGACFLAFGYETTIEAVVEAFGPEIEEAIERPVDFKSMLQERLARRGEQVRYRVLKEEGPPHDRRFTVAAVIGDEEVARGRGRSKKDAEQEAARGVLESIGE